MMLMFEFSMLRCVENEVNDVNVDVCIFYVKMC